MMNLSMRKNISAPWYKRVLTTGLTVVPPHQEGRTLLCHRYFSDPPTPAAPPTVARMMPAFDCC